MSKLKAKKPEEVQPGKSKVLLWGPPGAGKTWLALNFPVPYFIDTEGGADLKHYMRKLKASGGGYLGPEDGSNDLDIIIGQVRALATESHPYKTLVIDSLTKPYDTALGSEKEAWTSRYGDKKDYGSTKQKPLQKLRTLLALVDKIDMNVLLIAHAALDWDAKEEGKDPRKADIWDKVIHDLDLALRIEHVNQGIRNAVVTKSRLEGFPEFSRFPLQEKDKDVGYQNFAERYGRDFIEADVKPIALASPEQVAEIERLAEVVTGGSESLVKALSKAEVDSVSEFTQDQATKVIEWFHKKINPKEKEEK